MKTINIMDLEQGNIGSSGNIEDTYKIRISSYIRANPSSSVILSATSSTGKVVQVNLIGYESNTTNNNLFNLYWYDSPHIFDISNYTKTRYLRAVFKYKDGTKITPEEILTCTIEINYSWYIDENGNLRCSDMPYAPEKTMSKPYPAALWRIDESISSLPYHELLPIEKPAGAFMNVANLEYARIPETVRKIGRYAFAGTALSKVKISSECEFFNTSFPKNCLIEFYGNVSAKHSEQLYDSDGNILIDADGARIYT